MSLSQLLVIGLGGTVLIISIALIWGQVVAELHHTFNPNRDLEGEWLKVGHPQRQPLVTVRNEHGRQVAVRADQAHKWDDRHEGIS